ncbi:MAG: 2-oxoacid:acceptor oxidoreductase subunit alpha [Ignavibacteria bacterium]|nr:2-oxoacid:acceptor oxidoreductase subunit alpha [Ignavibacteria bacterium]
MMNKKLEELSKVTIRFAGDSGDGMQLTGSQFSDTTALTGKDLSTLPDYPAEIRAPAGTLYGVSGFQINFGSVEINTPGDQPNVLIAMNPAALKVNLKDLDPGALIIVNTDSFDDKNLKLAHYENNPLSDGTLSNYNLIEVPITTLTVNSLEGMELSMKEMTRSKNFFALGLMYWLFNKPMEPTIEWIHLKFKKNQQIANANEKALKAGYFYGDTAELFTTRYDIKPAKLEPGTYRNVMGNEAVSLGFVAASVQSGLPLFLGTYPITPASDILHELSKHKNFGVRTFQAEDEISGICSAIGAAFGGALAITTTSGPGMSLKTEAMGLAVMTEMPMVIVNVQRGGPSTGLPTKTEQADLLQSMYSRNGEAPIPIIAASSPADCFYTSLEATRLAIKYMTPVIFLTDGYIANGSEPWKLPDIEKLPKIDVSFRTDPNGFEPYLRDEFLARPWVQPGTPGLEHRIGGLEKKHITGGVSYDPENHEFMVNLREEKVKKIADELPQIEIYGESEGELLVVGWGGTYGAIRDGVNRARNKGHKVSQIHLKYLFPFQKNLGEILRSFKQILIPELNLGQLATLIRSEFLIAPITLSKIQGLPFRASEIEDKILELMKEKKED